MGFNGIFNGYRPSSVIKHGLLENGPFLLVIFPLKMLKHPFSDRGFSSHGADETGGYPQLPTADPSRLPCLHQCRRRRWDSHRDPRDLQIWVSQMWTMGTNKKRSKIGKKKQLKGEFSFTIFEVNLQQAESEELCW